MLEARKKIEQLKDHTQQIIRLLMLDDALLQHIDEEDLQGWFELAENRLWSGAVQRCRVCTECTAGSFDKQCEL